MDASFAVNEPLSPELVLVLPPELRADVLARLPAPVWPLPRQREPAVSAGRKPVAHTLGRIVVSRVVGLVQIFAAITVLTVAMSLIAHALR